MKQRVVMIASAFGLLTGWLSAPLVKPNLQAFRSVVAEGSLSSRRSTFKPYPL
jgi:hypothetical protein